MAASKIIPVLLAVLISLGFIACNDTGTVSPPPLPPQLSFDFYNTGNGLPNDDVYDIYGDSQGRIWFATEQGLGLLDNGTMTTISQAEGLIHPNTRAVLEFDGKFYIATWGGGVGVYDGSSWESITEANGLVNNTVMRIAADDTSLYFATAGGVSQYNPSTGWFRRFTSLLPKPRWNDTNKKILKRVEISSVVPMDTPRGPEVWMGAIYGYITVWRPAINDFKTYTPDNSGLPGVMINDIMYNSVDGFFWVGTALHGVAAVDVPNSTWHHYNQVDGLPSAVVSRIAHQQDGTVWLATNEGIARQDGDTFVGYGRASGLPTERVRVAYVDSQDRVWFGFVEDGAGMLK